ncbi:MAG: DegT/DnrJ/EryC1/StrS family aminotransferase [bacterium]
MHVPFLDLSVQSKNLRAEFLDAIGNVIESRRYIMGPEVSALEAEIARYCGARHAIGVSSGTDALLAALMAVGVSPGDEVVTTPFTFFATAGTIARLGAKPVFADIEPGTFNLDPEKAEAALTARTKAVLPVHLYGRCASMAAFTAMAKARGIRLIEDAAQAIGARTGAVSAGAAGDIGCFSFHPTKNLGALGDAGMAVTQDEELARRLRSLRVHGSTDKYMHGEVGGNFRLDTLQAAVLLVKLKYLDEWSRRRLENARRYNALFEEAGLEGERIAPPEIPEEGHVFHQYVVRAKDRDALAAFLLEREIHTGVYYPLSLHLQPCFAYLGYREGDFPESEKASREVLALPVHPDLPADHLESVVQSISDFYLSAVKA